MAPSFSTPVERIEVVIEVKKSRFIAWADQANDRNQAMAVLAQARQQYPDAGHHCWAYLIGSPSQPITQAMSDDGEPSGTAGKPILNVLQHKTVGNVIIVVSRYFGGIKLGAGGLVRSYSQAAQSAIDSLKTEVFVPHSQLSINCEYPLENEVRRWLTRHQGALLTINYHDHVEIEVSIPSDQLTEWQDFSTAYAINSKLAKK